jgi:hypothetical protein
MPARIFYRDIRAIIIDFIPGHVYCTCGYISSIAATVWRRASGNEQEGKHG